MCMGGSMPKATTPAAAPAPAPDAPTAPLVNDSATSGKNVMAANAAGSNGFKVDLAGPSVSGGSGLSIPTGA
jgi:hypothetical protein